MQKVKIIADKSAPMSPMIRLMCGDSRTQIVHFIVNRLFGDVDLCDLSWRIKVVNAKGESDLHDPYGEVVCSAEQIDIEWLVHGVATSAPGETRYELIGVDESVDGDPIVWQSGIGVILLTECLDAESAGDTEQLSELDKLIVYVDGELKNVIASGEAAADAAKRANDAADRIENSASGGGADGASAYEIAVKNGFVGTESEWLESLKGEPGRDGVDGKDGEPGEGASALVVSFDYHGNYNVVLDKTFEEIRAAYEAGNVVYARDSIGRVYTLTRTAANGIHFENADDSMIKRLYVASDPADTYMYEFKRITEDSLPISLPNPMPLIIQGSTNALYNGEEQVFVRVVDNWNDLRSKPFGNIGKNEVLVQRDIEFDEDGVFEVEAYLDVEDGATYEMDFGGEKFTSAAKAGTIENVSYVCIGNPALTGFGEDTGEPFAIYYFPSMFAVAFVYPTAASSTVYTTVTGFLTKKKISAEYLPESLDAINAANAGDLLRVDENGNLQPVKVGEELEVVDGSLRVKPEGSQELLFTIETTGEAQFVINELDGAPLNLTYVHFAIDASNSATASITAELSGNIYIGTTTMSTTDTGKFVGAKFYQEKGWWTWTRYASGSEYAYGATYDAGERDRHTSDVARCPHITKITLKNVKQTAGTIIKIWGVRA